MNKHKGSSFSDHMAETIEEQAAEIERLTELLKSIRVQAVVNGIEGHEALVKRINEALKDN